MLREMLRSRPNPRSKVIFKKSDMNSMNLQTIYTINQPTATQTSLRPNSMRGIETSNFSLKKNSNLIYDNNIDIATESNRFASSTSPKEKTNSSDSNNNNENYYSCTTGNNNDNPPNDTIKNIKTQSSQNNSKESPKNQNEQKTETVSETSLRKQYDQETETPKDAKLKKQLQEGIMSQKEEAKKNKRKEKEGGKSKESQQVDYLNTSPTPKDPSKIISTTSVSTNRLQTLESFITQIKQNVFDKSKPYLNQKARMKDNLKTNVDILASNIRTVHKEHRINGDLNKTILKENDRLISTGERASRDTFFMHKELPYLRAEIDGIKTLISQNIEESKYIRNDSIQLERDIMLVKDEIKKTNGQISQLLREKEKLGNAKVLVVKHIEMANEKIVNLERSSNELMNSVKSLVEQSTHVYDYVKM